MISTKIQLSNPLVSIIIPSYNRIDTIGKTIESILEQKCNFNFEIIIGDDNSTLETRNILTKYKNEFPDKIKLIFHEKNIGLGANWATCIKNSDAKYIANCDNDDYWHNPNKLQLQVDFFEKNHDIGVCHTDFRDFYRKSGKIIEEVVSNRIYDTSMQQAIFKGQFKFCNATMMYRKELIDRYLSLDDFIKYQFTLQDWVALIVLAKHTKFYCLPVSTATLGIDSGSITRANDINKLNKRFEKEKECYKYVCNLFPKDLYYNEVEYDNFSYFVRLNFGYLNKNYKVAKFYGSLILKNGTNESLSRRIKILSSQNWFLFILNSYWFKFTQKE